MAAPYLESAVVDGIVKRLDRILDRAALRERLTGLLDSEKLADAPARIGTLEADLASTRRRIGRLVEALAAGSDGLPSVRTALAELQRDRERLDGELATRRDRAGERPATVDSIVDAMLEELGRLPALLASDDPEERKRVVRGVLAGIRMKRRRGRRC